MGYEREMSARQKALELNKKKDAMEAEMESIVSALTENGGPGMRGNLTDAEGFPRADIDVHAVRTQRNRYAVLRTDLEKITTEIEKYLHLALAPPPENAQESGSSDATPGSAPAETPTMEPTEQPVSDSKSVEEASSNGPANDEAPASRRPAFALVDIVSENSPAAAAGLLVNDKIVSFGAISLRSFSTPQLAMQALPGLLRAHENQVLDVIVERGENPSPENITLNLTPRRWSGAGLLGCHVMPLQVNQVDSTYAPDVASAFMHHTRPGHV